MSSTILDKTYLVPGMLFALASACSTNRTEAAPAIALSESREGLPPEPGAIGIRAGRSGDTLVCEKPRKFSTAEGNRWLWVRILVERKPGSDTDNTIAEAVVSSDAEGRQYGPKVELAGVSLDGDKDYTLRNTVGVRTAEPKDSPKQLHHARAYTVGPNVGPFEISCGA
jgi:hypothetical protein